MFTKLFCYI